MMSMGGNMGGMDMNMPMMDMPHQGPLFLPWHRWYILKLEEELGVPIPYWVSVIYFI
jgi:hypothetical protein